MNIPWDLIIAAVLEMLEKCLDDQTEAAVKDRLHNPRALDWLRLRAGLFRRGVRRADLDNAMAAAREQTQAVTGDDDWANELIAQARAK